MFARNIYHNTLNSCGTSDGASIETSLETVGVLWSLTNSEYNPRHLVAHPINHSRCTLHVVYYAIVHLKKFQKTPFGTYDIDFGGVRSLLLLPGGHYCWGPPVRSFDIMIRFVEQHCIYNMNDGVLCSGLFAV